MKIVYMVLESSNLSARKILVLHQKDPGVNDTFLHVNWIKKI